MEKKNQSRISDYLEAIVALLGAVMSAGDVLFQLYSFRSFRPDVAVAIGLILFIAFGILAIIKAIRKSRSISVPERKQVIISKSKSGGRALSVGGDINAPVYIGDITNEKKAPEENLVNWDNVHFDKFNKESGDIGVPACLVIENGKKEIIQKCFAELINIYDQNFYRISTWENGKLPCASGWEIDGKLLYGETDIRVDRKKYIALIYYGWIITGSGWYYIGGENNFQYNLSNGKTYFAKVEISGMIGTNSLEPTRKFIEIDFCGEKPIIKDVSDELPIKK
jgi:hypothetical protein